MAEADGNRTRQGAFAPSTVLKTAEPTRHSDASIRECSSDVGPGWRARNAGVALDRANLPGVSDRDFAGLIRQSRERLGLTASRVAELIGRAPGTIRAWEKGTSQPSDAVVVSSLAAVLGIEEGVLFEAAGLEPPVVQSRPTVRQALSSIAPEATVDAEARRPAREDEVTIREPVGGSTTFKRSRVEESKETELVESATVASVPAEGRERHVAVRPSFADRLRAATVRRQPRPASAPSTLPPAPRAPSYLEDPTERWSYRLRSIYTAVGVVVLFLVLGWAAANFFSSLGEVWEILTSNL